jgi:hypothetical protein
MTTVLKFFMLAFVIVNFSACNTTKANTTNPKGDIKGQTQSTTTAPTSQEYKGIIIHSTAEDDCEYVIALEDDRSVMFDPVNLLGNFKKNGTRVWFTFRSLKMPNRCKKANPISITEIRERKIVKKETSPKE